MLKKIRNILRRGLGRDQAELFFNQTHQVISDDYIQKNLFLNEKYANDKKLNKYEHQFFSQSGEDGIIEEIFKRIGTTNLFFIEFGVGNGLENNTTSLLNNGWKGLWLECNQESLKFIENKFKKLIDQKVLTVDEGYVNAENIQTLFEKSNVPLELDLLSIDIDGNDYWVWNAISKYSPRVVVIEYNPLPGPSMKWVMKYNPVHVYQNSSYYGSSLKSLELLGTQKGYKLVGCNFTGANAFFIREDLVGDKFLDPYTSENHYEPSRYFLLKKNGHARDIGEFTNI
jgi:hypothetical protein